MMARVTKYGSYRGRNHGGKIALAVILVAIIVACMVYLISTGAFTMPSLSFGEEVTAEEVEAPLDITISEPEVEPEEPTPVFQVQGLSLSGDVTTWPEVDLTLYNSVVIPVKDSAGKLYTASLAEQAAFTALLSTDVHAVAQITTLLDSPYALAHVEGAGLKNTGGFIFYDGNGKNWLDPGKEGTQTYLTELALSLVDLGFDEILLTDVTYPTYGSTDKIAYTADPASQGLSTLVAVLADALQGTDATLSIQISEESLVNGQVPYSDFAPYISRFYVDAEHADTVNVILSEKTELVIITPTPLASGAYLVTQEN